MRLRSCLLFVGLFALSLPWWDLRTLNRNKRQTYINTYNNDYTIWPNATKDYNDTTCENELRPYIVLPPITNDDGQFYDVGQLKAIKNIGDSFLQTLKRHNLFDTVKLVVDTAPLNETSKILDIMEYQLPYVVIVVVAVVLATIILVAYILFWSMKLTGNIEEVNTQRIADSEGPMRFILTFLICTFTIFVMAGCIIAWVANIHITNNVAEASKQISWIVNRAHNFTYDTKEQMNTLFIKNYRDIFINTLSERLNESVHNASAYVYIEIERNITDNFNQSLKLANSIGDDQAKNIKKLKEYWDSYNDTLYPILLEIKNASDCIEIIDKWCAANSGKCDDKYKINKDYLQSVDPTKVYVDEIISAANDVLNISENGALGATSEAAFNNGKYFHNGTLFNLKNWTWFSDNPSYTENCTLLDYTTGSILLVQDMTLNESLALEGENKTAPENSLTEEITCDDQDGCFATNSSTKLFWGQCCVDVQYELDQSSPTTNNSDYTLCGPGQVWEKGKLMETGNQSLYRGNYSQTVTGKPCEKWDDITKEGKSYSFWAISQGYAGLYWNDDAGSFFKHNFCRNPSPTLNLYGITDEDDVRYRAWCFTDKDDLTKWEYCAVPYCSNDTATALALNGTTDFFYPSCNYLYEQLYGEEGAGADGFTLWVTSKTPREEAYFSLDEAKDEIDAQYEVISDVFNETDTMFTELKQTILASIEAGSDASKFDAYRNIGTIVIVCFCMASACLAVAGVCMGYCNITPVPPHLRSSGSNLGGTLIKISAYWAALMAIINLYMATLFFVPGTIFSLICFDYNNKWENGTSNNLMFNLLDQNIIVNYSILGRAVLSNDTYNMTLYDLWDGCKQDLTLWEALGLADDPDYAITSLLQINETLDLNHTWDSMRDKQYNNFDEFPVYPDNLKFWLEFWNASNATELPWSTISSNLKWNFLGVTTSQLDKDDSNYLKINNKPFCEAFKPYGNQVDDDDKTSQENYCKETFKELLEDRCANWTSNYTKFQTWIDNMETTAALVKAQNDIYGRTKYLMPLMDQYTWTNNMLLNKNGLTFSYDIIKRVYDYWEAVSENEMECFDWRIQNILDSEIVQCTPIFTIIDNTMNYFCDYMVTAMTLAWMSQGLLGCVLALHMVVGSSLSVYFLRMEKRHEDDIDKLEMIASFQ